MTLSAIAAFPLAVFQGRHLDRLVRLGLVEIVDEWLEVTPAGREVLDAEGMSGYGEPPGGESGSRSSGEDPGP